MTEDDLDIATLAVRAALADGDSGLAYRLVLELMSEGLPMPTVMDAVLAPVQWESGQRWESGEVTISEEHAATAAIETLVAMLAGAFDQPVDADLIVVACAEGESHTLPARMASALLVYEGYRAVFLGTSVPADDLASYLEDAEAAALVLSCTRSSNLIGARSCIAAAHRVPVPVAVGGRAFGDDDRMSTLLGADARAARLPDLAALLETWQPDPISSEQAAVPAPTGVDALIAGRQAVAAGFRVHIADLAGLGSPAGELLAASSDELVDTLAVARYLDEPALLLSHGRWVCRLIEQRSGSLVEPEALLDALADAAQPQAPEAAALASAAARASG